MGFRFRKSIPLGKGVRLNFSKRGVGLSIGTRGARWSIGPSGIRGTIGIPGTGLYYEHRVGPGSMKKVSAALRRAEQAQAGVTRPPGGVRAGRPWMWVVVGGLLCLWTPYIGIPVIVCGLYLWLRALTAPPTDRVYRESPKGAVASGTERPLATSAPPVTYALSGMGPESRRYYDLLENIEHARAMRKYGEALELSLQALQHLPGLVHETVREFGKWDVVSIPPLYYACKYLSVLGKDDELRRVREVVSGIPALGDWVGFVDRALEETKLMRRVYDHLRHNPGFAQNRLGRALAVDGRVVANLILYAEQIGMLRRERDGRTYRVFLAEGPAGADAAPTGRDNPGDPTGGSSPFETQPS